MKKFLLAIAVGAAAFGVQAQTETVTINWSEEGYANAEDVTEVKKGDVTLTFDKGSNSNTPKYYNTGTALRLYGGNTMTVSVPEGFTLDKVEFTTGSSNKFNNASTATTGDFKIDGTDAVWTATETPTDSFVLTQGGTSGHVRIVTTTITYTLLDSSKEAAELSFPVEEATAKYGEAFEAPILSNPHSLAVTWNSSNEEVATVENGVVTIVGAGTTIISAASEATDAYYAGYASYALTVVRNAMSIPEMTELAPNKGDKVVVDFPLTVVYVNGAFNYVEDENLNASLIYGFDLGLKAGDVIPAGWEASNAIYNGLPEWNVSGELPAVAETVEVVYSTLGEVSEETLNCVGYLRKVTFAEATLERTADNKAANFEGTFNGETITFRTNFQIESVAAGEYDVLCAIAVYNGTFQVYPIKYEVVSAVQTVKAEGAAEYFTIDGLKVENPAKGLYIKVAGGKASKIVL